MPVDRLMLTFGLGLALVASMPASFAQGVDDLPDRPIARSEVLAVVKRQFQRLDTNRDGAVSYPEFQAFRAKQAAGGVPQSGVFDRVGGRWFERGDANGDGKVSLAEAQARPLQLFQMADSDGDGVVSLAERRVAQMMMALTGK